MDSLTADSLINSVLYGIDKIRDLTDEATQERFVQFMIDRRYFPDSVDEYAEAIGHTVRAGRLPDTLTDPSRKFTEAEQLAFLAALDRRLEDRKPWPAPAFVVLPVQSMTELADARPIARIDMPTYRLVGLLNHSLDQVPVGVDKIPVVRLRLRSGDEVVIIGSVDPRSTVFTLARIGDGDPAALIEHLREVTGLKPADVQPF
ncbi:hypothetical protein ACWKSP_22800 [Micromonosporaceae bacterium Da 78-11]